MNFENARKKHCKCLSDHLIITDLMTHCPNCLGMLKKTVEKYKENPLTARGIV